MQQTNIIGDTCKDRRIDYSLIDRINKQYEREGRKEELKARLAKKKGMGEGKEIKEKETEEQNPIADIRYIKTPDELRDIKGHYTLKKGIYTIDFEINVPNGCGLILEPGVTFEFIKDAGITCEGRFEAKGTNGLEVLLTAKDKDEGWKNLYLHGNAEAILDYAKFSYGKGRRNSKYEEVSGGAILLESKEGRKPSITINNSCFEKNSANLGGAVFFDDDEMNSIIPINNSYFKKNSALYGGALCIRGNVKIDRNNIFENNSARKKGGAIYNNYGGITINENNRFENNSAEYKGGAIRSYQGNLNIDKSKNTFKNNKPDDISET